MCLRRLGQFRRDENGVVLILFTLMLVPILLVVAVAIDFSQVLVIKRQLAGAADAAALTVAQMPDLDDEDARAKAENFIRAHYPDAAIGSLKTFNVVRGSGMVDVTATAEMPTSFLKIAGQETLEVTVHSQAVIAASRLEVVMVLDNTGSMDEAAGSVKKIEALKTAATTLVNILFGSAEESDNVRIGLVPFANAVNIGGSRRGAAWLDEANPSLLNREHITEYDDGGSKSVFRVFDALRNTTWEGCLRARTEPYDLTDAAPNAAVRETLFTPYFAPDEQSSSGGGSAYNSYLTNDPASYKKLSFYKDKTPLIPLTPPPPPLSKLGPNYNCPDGAVQPLTNVKSTITTAIGKMVARGSTVIPEGLAWGWRLISPGAPFQEGVPYTDKDTIKVVILLSDGENSVNPGTNGAYKSVFNAYGHAAVGNHLGPANGISANTVLDTKTATLCNTIKGDLDGDGKAENIILYTMTFGDDVPAYARTLMQNCASLKGKYFHAPTDDVLQSAFETIAYGLSKLRLAR